jgi:hypothetical protein
MYVDGYQFTFGLIQLSGRLRLEGLLRPTDGGGVPFYPVKKTSGEGETILSQPVMISNSVKVGLVTSYFNPVLKRQQNHRRC